MEGTPGNADLVREMFARSGSRFEDPNAAYDFLAPDVVFDSSAYQLVEGATVWRGHDEVRAFWRSWLSPWTDWEFHVEELAEAGDRVALVIRQSARGKSSGVTIDQRHGQVWTFRDREVVRVEFHPDRVAAWRAAGLEP